MDIGSWRDLIIVIFGIVGMVIGVVFLILIIMIYRKISVLLEKSVSVMEALQKAAGTVESFTQVATENLIKPIIEFAAVFQGIKAGLGGLFRRKV